MLTRSQKTPVVFVGTYTESEASQSEGIYVYRMDSASGELSFERVLKGSINPSFLAIHPQGGFLYAVNEVQSYAGQPGGGVSAFSLAADEPKLMNQQPSQGTDPCYISIEQTGKFALVANYSSGSVAMFPIQVDGRLGTATAVIQHSGSSVHPERQTGPHAHCILPDPTNRFAIAVDLGLDKLLIYAMDLEGGKLKEHAEVKVQAGAGPRHLTFHPSGGHAYLINELNSTLISYRYHSEFGSFEELQTVPTLPRDFRGENLCADVHIAPNGRYLYASNRGHDSIVCFLIDENTGHLIYQNHTFTEGREPRNFAIAPKGDFLLVANQKTDNILTFKIDSRAGKLLKTGHEVKVSRPVCVKFTYR
ncbi:MAG TPA: lactonase family protein [Anaerolineales bacterium]|nr:lactonase family protein [Anaerolineales bacterium]